MVTFSALLVLCAGNSPVTGEFPAQRPVTRIFDAFFDLRLNKRLTKQSWGWWFESPSRPLWHHCNGYGGQLIWQCSFGLQGIARIFVWLRYIKINNQQKSLKVFPNASFTDFSCTHSSYYLHLLITLPLWDLGMTISPVHKDIASPHERVYHLCDKWDTLWHDFVGIYHPLGHHHKYDPTSASRCIT